MKNNEVTDTNTRTLSGKRARRGLRTHLKVGAEGGGKPGSAKGHKDGNGFVAIVG